MTDHSPALIVAAKALAEKHGVPSWAIRDWGHLQAALCEALTTTPPSEEAMSDLTAVQKSASLAIAEIAAGWIRKSFFTSCSGGGEGYHLRLTYRSMDEMHKAEDAIKAFATDRQFQPLTERLAPKPEPTETAWDGTPDGGISVGHFKPAFPAKPEPTEDHLRRAGALLVEAGSWRHAVARLLAERDAMQARVLMWLGSYLDWLPGYAVEELQEIIPPAEPTPTSVACEAPDPDLVLAREHEAMVFERVGCLEDAAACRAGSKDKTIAVSARLDTIRALKSKEQG
jgi:hypothetical protein